MARKKPEATDRRLSVRHVEVENSRYLITVPSDSSSWTSEELEQHYRRINFVGAIVRLRPPATASDNDVERLRKFFETQQARRVIVLPRPRSELLPAKAEGVRQAAVTARSAVASLIEESNSKDKKALRDLCERVMGVVGL